MRNRNTLHSRDLTGEGAKRVNRFFVPSPTIVLFSCSTGARGGIGQKLSEVIGAKVIAPEKPTHFQKIKPIFDGDKIDFDIEYVSNSREANIKKEYVSGEIQ